MNSRTALLLLAGVALVYGALQWHMPHQAFWSNDGGEKLIQVKALVAASFVSPALPYDSLGLEPAGSFEFAPFLPGHARVVAGRLLSVVPIYFPLLSALPYKLWGHGGLYLLPLLGTLLTLYGLLLLARKLGDDPAAASMTVAAAGLASPLFFYGLTFWEHTLAAGLCTGGIFLLHSPGGSRTGPVDGQGMAAAFLMTLAAWLRGEVFVLLLACALAMLCCRPYRRRLPSFILGMSAALLPYVLLNHQLYATAASPQLPEPGNLLQVLAKLPTRWQDVASYLLTGYLDHPSLNRFLFLLSVAPALPVYYFRQPSPRRDALILTWCALLCLVSLVTLGRLFSLDSPMGSSMTILGLFGSLPYLPLALALARQGGVDPARNAALRFLGLVALLTLAGLCLGLPSRGGLQWGPRYALPLAPLLILLAVAGFAGLRRSLTGTAARRACTALFLLLLLSGTGIQAFGVHLLFVKKQVTIANMEAIRSMSPRVIITDTWWVPEDNGDLYGEYPFYSFYTYAKMDRLLSLLAGKGEEEFLLVSAADYREFIARQPGLAVTSFQQTTHPGMDMFNLSLHTIRLGQP